jgi:hypothetical protein
MQCTANHGYVLAGLGKQTADGSIGNQMHAVASKALGIQAMFLFLQA